MGGARFAGAKVGHRRLIGHVRCIAQVACCSSLDLDEPVYIRKILFCGADVVLNSFLPVRVCYPVCDHMEGKRKQSRWP